MAEFEGYTGVWRRLKSGAAIFIRDGEDIKKAVRRNFNSNKMREKADALIDKESDLTHKLYSSREKKDMLLKEKGELSKEYADAEVMEKTYKRERDNTYYERTEIEDNIRKLGSINRKGFNIKQEQANRLKEIGNTKKSLSDLRKAVQEYNSKKGVDNSISLKSEIELGEEKNKFADKYGYETMKEEMEKINKTTDKIQTPKQKAEAINEINKNGEEKLKIAKEVAREIYGKQISDVVAEKYGKELLQFSEGTVTTDMEDWELEKDGISKTKERLQADLIYYKEGYDASKKYIDNLKEAKAGRASLKTGVNDKDIENDIRSLFIYKNEKGMGSLDAEPLKRYYNKHGKENVDRVWKQMEDKYEVIEGTSMDSEGLRYNNLIEKSKYSPEAIQNYKNKMNTIYEKFGTNSRKYNEAAEAAADEFEKAPKTSTAKQMNYDAEVEKYYRTSSVDNISADLDERKRKMEQDWYAPNDKETYQKWNEATERYLINRMEGKKADTNRFKAEVSRTPKQRAAAIDKANDSYYEKTKKDLLSHYTKDYGYDGNPEEAFVKQMDAVNYGNATPYQMGKRLAEGGNYLIYNGDMKAYLSRRGIKATEDNAFDKYTDYIAKQSAKLYEEIKKNKK